MKDLITLLVFVVSVALMGGGIWLSLSDSPSWGWVFGVGAFFLAIVCCMVADDKV